jgi:hypothetical protein
VSVSQDKIDEVKSMMVYRLRLKEKDAGDGKIPGPKGLGYMRVMFVPLTQTSFCNRSTTL